MMLLFLALGCVHQVSWTEQHAARYPAPTTQVAVVAMEQACRPLAEAVIDALGSRPGVDVRPDAAERIFVGSCDDLVTTQVDVETNQLGLNYGNTVAFERRRYTLHGWARGEIEVQSPGLEPVRFAATAERDLRGPWISGGDLDIPASPALRSRLADEVADQLVQNLVPLPETVRRTVFPDPEPGTARQLHNDAVAAERAGNLDEALRLARSAYAADPSPSAMDYIETLESRGEAIGYAWKTAP